MQTQQSSVVNPEIIEKRVENLHHELLILITDVRKLAADPTVQLKQQILAELKRELLADGRKPLQRVDLRGKRKSPRFWLDKDKLAILSEAHSARKVWGGVREVCERHGITTAHLTQWKQQLEAKKP